MLRFIYILRGISNRLQIKMNIRRITFGILLSIPGTLLFLFLFILAGLTKLIIATTILMTVISFTFGICYILDGLNS